MRVLNFFLVTWFCGALAPSLSHGFTEQDLAIRSELWPDKITIKVPLVGQKHGNNIEPGREGIFLRLESGKCLVDLGHNGIFWLEIAQTDLLRRVEDAMGVRTMDSQGLFAYRYTKSFFWPETFRNYELNDWEDCSHFLIVYFEFIPESELVDLLSRFIESAYDDLRENHDTLMLLVPLNDIVSDGAFSEYLLAGLHAPTVVPFLREGTIHTLQHGSVTNGSVIAIDKNGRILDRTTLSEFTTGAELGPYLEGLRFHD